MNPSSVSFIIIIYRLNALLYKADVYSSQVFLSAQNLEENLHKIGRVICMKFDNILDALALFTNEIKLFLPLNNGKTEHPVIYPSKYLMKFIDDFNPQNPPNNLSTSGFDKFY